ncbi:rhizopuspepsin 6 precursor [Spinellus fusiger]|nr:rhizopuspepsin 6 precursor [Spinellus fusiger]
MKLTASIATILAVCSLSSIEAAPVAVNATLPHHSAPHVTFPLFHNPKYYPNATRAINSARGKYHKFLKTASTSSFGALPVTDYENDVEYYGTVQVGTPPQNLKLNFDTGSADLWFASTLCTSCGISHTKFNPAKSSTYKSSTGTWKITYGDKSGASGVVGFDTVTLGGVKIQNQGIELAKLESSSFVTDPVDGLVGLAFDSITTAKGVKTPVDNMISQGLISSPVFGVFLGKQSNGGGGEYFFGGINYAHIAGPLTTVPINKSQGFWQIKVAGVSGGDPDSPSSFGPTDAILDTGTTLLLLTDDMAADVANAYNAQDNGDGSFTIGCDTSDYAPLTFTIGGATFSVPPEDLIFQNDGTNCVAGFGYGGLPFAILGDVFLKNNYVVFNQQVPNVQIAPSQ